MSTVRSDMSRRKLIHHDVSSYSVSPMQPGSTDNSMTIAAPAKVNLFLELCAKRSDGFHELETVMAPVSLYDQIRFREDCSGKISLTMEQANSAQSASPSAKADNSMAVDAIPTDERNLIVATLLEMKRRDAAEHGERSLPGMEVHLRKNIPSAAGLGGASSNAAAAIVAGNEIWKLGWSDESVHRLAGDMGSDVPFFLKQTMALCTGRGELIRSIDAPASTFLVIAKPPVGLSTPTVYGNCQVPAMPVSSESILRAVANGSATGIGGCLFNRLQEFAAPLCPWIDRMANEFGRLPVLGHQMSGSGTSYFGVFANERVARAAAATIRLRMPEVLAFSVRTLGKTGVERRAPVTAKDGAENLTSA